MEKILDDSPALKGKWLSLIPQGKMGQPKDLMGAVTFLCSDSSGYVSKRKQISLLNRLTY
jgi:D-arabinitol 2-dehydrogenase